VVSSSRQFGSLLQKAFWHEARPEVEEVKSLVERSRSGDLDAFGQIVRRFQDMAYGFAYSILGDFHCAEDVAQEAFIDAYRQLADLRKPEAFPGWFRRIVFKYCDRVIRRKRAQTAPIDDAMPIAANDAGPARIAEGRELEERVLDAVRALPGHQRTATTLFYINGYSQKEIAAFLEVPVTTVKKRLHDSRKRLRKGMIDMVENTLKSNTPDERFSQRVIAELLARPRPLEIEGHPIRDILETIRSSLPEYDLIEGQETVEKSAAVIGDPKDAYHVDENRILRTQTTDTIIQSMAGREPPVRLLTAGRVFRPDAEDRGHLKVFHQIDVLCVQAGANPDTMKATIRKVLESLFSPAELKWRPACFAGFEHCLETDIRIGESWFEVVGCGMLTAETLRQGGHDPESASGFAFGMGLERLAALKLGIGDIRKLWQPPYVPEEAQE